MRYFLFLLLFISGYNGFSKNTHSHSLSAGGLFFTENRGQITDQNGKARNDIQFQLSDGGFNIFIGKGQIHYQWATLRQAQGNTLVMAGLSNQDSRASSFNSDHPSSLIPHSYQTYRMDVRLIDADPSAQIIAEDTLHSVTIYYTNGLNGVRAYSFRKIVYKNIYPAIDWVLYIDTDAEGHAGLKYDFIVHPGGDPSDIQLQYEGATTLRIDKDGSFSAMTPMGNITEQAPYCYNVRGKELPSRFLLKKNILSFETAPCAETFCIDPSLAWATYYGGSGYDRRGNAACDTSGNVYLAGDTESPNNIATSGSYRRTIIANMDVMLVKFNEGGVRQWATYYGGADNDYGWSVACDALGNVYVAGQTTSDTGIATPSSHQPSFGRTGSDAFLVKFNSNGTREWGTYYGGRGTGGFGVDYGFSVTCDKFSNVYLAGSTTSQADIANLWGYQYVPGNFGPSSSGMISADAFLVKFDRNGLRKWATYYGGDGDDEARAVTCDSFGDVYLSGRTTSDAHIASSGSYQSTRAGDYDAFLVKFKGSSGVRLWGTYYGGTAEDEAYGVHCDLENNVYLTGNTHSHSGIATPGSHQPNYGGNNWEDAYLAKFDANGSRLWATYYGGDRGDGGTSVSVDHKDNVIMAGYTNSTTAIATPNGYQTNYNGSQDAFIVKLNANGQPQWGTYYGGPGLDYGYSVTADRDRIYLAGQTVSQTNISTPAAHQPVHGGGVLDNYLVRFNDCLTPVATIQAQGPVAFCEGDSVVLTGTLGDSLSYQWQQNGMAIPGATNAQYAAVVSGNYRVTVFNGSCPAISDTLNVLVYPDPAVPRISSKNLVCLNDTLSLSAVSSGAIAYHWSGPEGFSSDKQRPFIFPAKVYHSGVYTVIATSDKGCLSQPDSVKVTVLPFDIAIGFKDTGVCFGDPVTFHSQIITVPDSFSDYAYQWSPSQGLNDPFSSSPEFSETPGDYTYVLTVKIKDTTVGCVAKDTATVHVFPPAHLFNVTVEQTIQYGSSIRLHVEGALYYTWSPAESLDDPQAPDPLATPQKPTLYTVLGTDENGCQDTATVKINIDYGMAEIVPSAFSPNGDGLNDIFRVEGITYQQVLEFRVFNRWGQELFFSRNVDKGWDGRWNGKLQDVGVYYYIIKLRYPDGRKKEYSGDVTLMR